MKARSGNPDKVQIFDRGRSWTAYRIDQIGSCRLADFAGKIDAWRFAVECLQAGLPTFWNAQPLGLTQARREARG